MIETHQLWGSPAIFSLQKTTAWFKQKKKTDVSVGMPELFIPAQHMKRLLTPQLSNTPKRGSSWRRRGLRAPIESRNYCEGEVLTVSLLTHDSHQGDSMKTYS